MASGIIGHVAEATEQRRPGRPRLRPAASEGLSAREEILDAAAALFVSQGLAATTTRQIAERVGIRQASLYYYFGGKNEMLLELLTSSVRPSLSVARYLESVSGTSGAGAAGGLYALAVTDVRTLVAAPHNIGMLYLSPEVQGSAFESFRAERASLQEAYGRLGRAASVAADVAGAAGAGAGMDQELTAALLMQLVESVIPLRRSGAFRDGYADSIAEACLRLVGLAESSAARARTAAESLLAGAAGRCT
jgi:AcrR family transcriptional regulator